MKRHWQAVLNTARAVTPEQLPLFVVIYSPQTLIRQFAQGGEHTTAALERPSAGGCLAKSIHLSGTEFVELL